MTILPPLSELPVIFPDGRQFVMISPDGEIRHADIQTATFEIEHSPVLVCHRLWTEARLGCVLKQPLDVLELFGFVRPAQFCLPAPDGLAMRLNLPAPTSAEDKAVTIARAAQRLLDELADLLPDQAQKLAGIADMMRRGGWAWAPEVLGALGHSQMMRATPDSPPDGRPAHIWNLLEPIDETVPRQMAGTYPVSQTEVADRLSSLLGGHAEQRSGQADYASAMTAMFDTPDEAASPHVILAEAGTGTGKTLGYLAPASLWAEHNKAPVWISTYTRTLQHQIAAELTRLYPQTGKHNRKVVIRKGRENYLCLLNLEEHLGRMPGAPQSAIALGLMARWASASSDGDLTGAGFPAWLSDILGRRYTTALADRRGECIHSGCSHYHKCFVERSIRSARTADIVIANHALVMIQAIMQAGNEGAVPTRYIFDEGHHVFDAADSTFSVALTALETIELRLWIRGAEDGRAGRARGLKRRLEELVADNDEALAALEEASEAARILPWTGWSKRLAEAAPMGAAEAFFVIIRKLVYARADNPHSHYDLQTDLYPCPEELIAAARAFKDGLEGLLSPLMSLAAQIEKILNDEADTLDTQTRQRLEGLSRSLLRRASGPVAAWCQLLGDLSVMGRDGFVDWMQISRIDSTDRDVGIFRHWLDPSIPFAEAVLGAAHGVGITSATLTDSRPDNQAEDTKDTEKSKHWQSAIQLTGAQHLTHPAILSSHSSPFDYGAQARIFVIQDVARDRAETTASAMSALISASDGRALSLFTSIQRLKACWPYLADSLSQQNIALYAQHQDRMNLQTLLQLFRDDPRSVLMGTDAVRDGVDVPGDALQMMIYDRVPWPRPDKLFQARADWIGRTEWTDRLTRMKLRQAFGRLIRRKDDRGVFVILDSRLPTRLTAAFPPEIEIQRVGLAEAVEKSRLFLNS